MNLVRNCMVKPLSILSELSMEIKTNLSPALIGYCLYSNVVLEHCRFEPSKLELGLCTQLSFYRFCS